MKNYKTMIRITNLRENMIFNQRNTLVELNILLDCLTFYNICSVLT